MWAVAVPTLTAVVAQPSQLSVALRPRAFVSVSGPEAEDYLQRMVSNDVEALAVGEVCDALLLTPKARVIATLRVWRRGEDDFLLLTEPEFGDAVVAELRKMRFAAKCEIEPEQHTSTIVFGGDEGIPNDEYGVLAREVLDVEFEPTIAPDELERMRIEAGTPRTATSSTTASCRPRPGSTRPTSASPRAATRARSRSRACTTGGTSIGSYECSRSRRRARATRSNTRESQSAASRARCRELPWRTCATRFPTTQS